MLSIEAENILKTARETRDQVLVVRHSGGALVQISKSVMGGDDEDRRMAYIDEVEALTQTDLLRQLSSEVFELTTAGRRMADALISQEAAEAAAPDTCTLRVDDEVFTVEFTGVHCHYPGIGVPDEFPIVGGYEIIDTRYYKGHDGWFNIVSGDERRTLRVATLVPNLECFRDRDTVTRAELHMLLKRPGLRVVREHVLGRLEAKPNDLHLAPRPEIPEGEARLQSLEDYVDLSDDARTSILADCEQDVLGLVHEAHSERRPLGVTALEVAASPLKRRFYSARNHIQVTLDDLCRKNLIRTDDRIHYEIEVSRLGDVPRLLEGVSSDRLFDESAEPQPAVYVPRSTNEHDAFLCHASEDKEAVVRPFAEVMDEEGLVPWLDEVQVGWGDNLAQQIQDGLSRSRYVVVFLSRAFLAKKGWTDKELYAALSMSVGKRRFVLPIVLGITHEELENRYSLVSGTIYKDVPDYDPATPVSPDVLRPFVVELKGMIDEGS